MDEEQFSKFVNYLDYLLASKLSRNLITTRISRWFRRRDIKVSKKTWKHLNKIIDRRLKFREDSLLHMFLRILREEHNLEVGIEDYKYLKSLNLSSEDLMDQSVVKKVVEFVKVSKIGKIRKCRSLCNEENK